MMRKAKRKKTKSVEQNNVSFQTRKYARHEVMANQSSSLSASSCCCCFCWFLSMFWLRRCCEAAHDPVGVEADDAWTFVSLSRHLFEEECVTRSVFVAETGLVVLVFDHQHHHSHHPGPSQSSSAAYHHHDPHDGENHQPISQGSTASSFPLSVCSVWTRRRTVMNERERANAEQRKKWLKWRREGRKKRGRRKRRGWGRSITECLQEYLIREKKKREEDKERKERRKRKTVMPEEQEEEEREEEEEEEKTREEREKERKRKGGDVRNGGKRRLKRRKERRGGREDKRTEKARSRSPSLRNTSGSNQDLYQQE